MSDSTNTELAQGHVPLETLTNQIPEPTHDDEQVQLTTVAQEIITALASTDGEKVEDEPLEQPRAHEGEDIPQTPQVALTFLLVSGRRRTMFFEPETAIGRVKELVWNSWPSGEFHGC